MSALGDLGDAGVQCAVAGMHVGECKAEPGRGRSGPGEQLRIPRLRQVDQAAVVAEEGVEQLRMAVELQTVHDEPIEETHQEIGEVERARLVIGQAFEEVGASENS